MPQYLRNKKVSFTERQMQDKHLIFISTSIHTCKLNTMYSEFVSVAKYFNTKCGKSGRNLTKKKESNPVKSSILKPRFHDSNHIFSTAEIIRPYGRPPLLTNYDTKTPAPLLDPPPSLSLEDAADWPCASSPSPTNRML